MPALARGDAERLLCFVGEAESLGGDDPFTGELLVELGKLISADWVTYNELDRVRKRVLFYLPRPGDDDDSDGEIDDAAWEIMLDHPVCRRHFLGDFGAHKLSDFLTRSELHRTQLFNLWFREWGIEHELSVAVPSPLWHTQSVLFDRKEGKDFTERDRLVLDLLQPHFARIGRAARTRRLLAAALAGLEQAERSDRRGVILLANGDEVEFASPAAQRLLDEFFPAQSGGLPPAALAEWLQSGTGQPLILRRGSRGLTVERTTDTLLLEERHDDVQLTVREREVLAWVARGKTNAEIAELLWLAPSTVRKHLENVYAKLGVRTRTAAVARFLGLIEPAGDSAASSQG